MTRQSRSVDRERIPKVSRFGSGCERRVTSLDRNVIVDSTDITVEVVDGVVSPSGEARDLFTDQAVYDTAIETCGVVDVVNEVNIASVETRA